MQERLTVHQRVYQREVRAAQARSLEALFDRWVTTDGIKGVVPEFRFHPIREWCLDRAIPSLKVCAEIQGGRWLKKSGHSNPTGLKRDAEKSNALQELGWLCAYMTGDMVADGSGFSQFKKFISMRNLSPLAPNEDYEK